MSSPIFSKVKAQYAKTSLFNLGHEVKLTTDFGRLTPVYCGEVIPGDKWRGKTEILVRLAPTLYPIMHQIKVFTHWFFVPYRLLWDNWESFITQSQQGTYNSALDIPNQVPLILDATSEFTNGCLRDYLGAQSFVVNNQDGTNENYYNALPFYAYQKIYDDYYRDENLQQSDFVKAQDSPLQVDTNDDYPFNLRFRSWKKDYFTSALPFVQKGPDVVLPLSGNAPVEKLGGDPLISDLRFGFMDSVGGVPPTDSSLSWKTDGPTSQIQSRGTSAADKTVATDIYGTPDDMYVNLNNVTSITINELRRANALQRWEELNARGGTRYIEQLATHFGVTPQDARLQRPQYLGGGVSDVVISEVLQTAPKNPSDSKSTVLGSMGGHGISASFNHAFNNYFPEHGVVMCIMSIMPRGEYYQGCKRMFMKRGVYDFAWPSLAHLGEQPIYNQELYNDGVPADPETKSEVFGYTPRYAEYKFENDRICGDFRGSLESWHLGRKFANQPQLNEQFISTENFKQNVFAVEGVDPFWCQLYLDLKVIRKLPKFGTPRL